MQTTDDDAGYADIADKAADECKNACDDSSVLVAGAAQHYALGDAATGNFASHDRSQVAHLD